MAVSQSLTNFIRFAADGDTVSSTRKLLLSGFIFAKPNTTSQASIKVMNGASNMEIIPTSIFASGVQPPPIMFEKAQPVAGLKATTCTNVVIIAVLEGASG